MQAGEEFSCLQHLRQEMHVDPLHRFDVVRVALAVPAASS